MKKISTLYVFFFMSIAILAGCDQQNSEQSKSTGDVYGKVLLPEQIIEYRDNLQEAMHTGYLVKAEALPYEIYPPMYKITIYRDPLGTDWPDWYSLLVEAEIYVTTVSPGYNPVVYRFAYAGYQNITELDSYMLVEGLRQVAGENTVTVNTLGLLDDAVITENLPRRVRFRHNNRKWKIVKNDNITVTAVQEEYLVTPEAFAAGIADNAPGYHVTLTPVMTIVPPSGYMVTVESIMDCGGDADCYFPGMLNSLVLYGIESYGGPWDPDAELLVTTNTIECDFYDINPAPDGDMLYYGMYLRLRGSGIKTICNYMLIAEMTKIRIKEVSSDGTIYFIDPDDRYWAILRIDGEVVLEELSIIE